MPGRKNPDANLRLAPPYRAELRRVEAEIDRAAARLWGLSDEELTDIQASLKELKG